MASRRSQFRGPAAERTSRTGARRVEWPDGAHPGGGPVWRAPLSNGVAPPNVLSPETTASARRDDCSAPRLRTPPTSPVLALVACRGSLRALPPRSLEWPRRDSDRILAEQRSVFFRAHARRGKGRGPGVRARHRRSRRAIWFPFLIQLRV